MTIEELQAISADMPNTICRPIRLGIPALLLVIFASNANPAERITLAGLPCSQLLTSYGTQRGGPWLQSISEDVSRMDVAGLSAANSHNLPVIPIGGATSDPKIQAEWRAYERWLKHQGPKPHYSHDR